MIKDVESILRTLGVGRHYKGYELTCHVLRLAMEDPSRLCNMKKYLFAPTAEAFGCDERTIERNLRTLICRAWDNDAETMRRIAGYRLLWRPPVSEFLSFMVDYAKGVGPLPSEKQRGR